MKIRMTPKEFEDFQQQWKDAKVWELPDLLAAAELSTSQRVDLAKLGQGDPDFRMRAQYALGKMNFIKDDMYAMWQDLCCDLNLLEVAIDNGLHMRYFTPMESSNLFSNWLSREDSLGAQCAALAWEKAVSAYARPHIIVNVIDPRFWCEAHTDAWSERLAAVWGQMPPEGRVNVLRKVLTELIWKSGHEKQGNALSNHWLDLLFNDCEYKTSILKDCVCFLKEKLETNNWVFEVVNAKYQADLLQGATPHLPKSSYSRRL